MIKNNVKNIAARGLTGALTLAALLALVQVSGMVSAAAGPERSLAGIHIFDPGSQVTAKFGNPSRILVGGVAPGAFSAGGAGGSSSGGYGMGGPGGGQGPQGASMGQPSQGQRAGAGLLPGFSGVPMGSSGAGGGFPGAGGGFPGAGGGEFPGAPGGGAGAAVLPPKEAVTLIYDRQNGGSLEFTISPDKRVVQIRETGYNGAYGTARGIKLGMKYSDVNRLYGYPENTLIQGAIINTDYKDSLHCGFQFLDQKLVGIIVASPD